VVVEGEDENDDDELVLDEGNTCDVRLPTQDPDDHRGAVAAALSSLETLRSVCPELGDTEVTTLAITAPPFAAVPKDLGSVPVVRVPSHREAEHLAARIPTSDFVDIRFVSNKLACSWHSIEPPSVNPRLLLGGYRVTYWKLSRAADGAICLDYNGGLVSRAHSTSAARNAVSSVSPVPSRALTASIARFASDAL
jgi:hypothetical protein